MPLSARETGSRTHYLTSAWATRGEKARAPALAAGGRCWLTRVPVWAGVYWRSAVLDGSLVGGPSSSLVWEIVRIVGVAEPSNASRSFGRIADLYERLRPTYPAGALDAVLPADARRVVDVGAGTGKLTAVLVARGLDVIAVEPDDRMRAVLTATVSQADARAGAAEQLPLADGEVQAVLFAQAWHWADPDLAAREARRVLTSGGVLAMLWNLHDDRIGWVAELNRLTGSGAAITTFNDPPDLPGFAAGVRREVPWRMPLHKDELIDLARTWSSVGTRPAAEQKQILDSVQRMLETDPQFTASDVIELPYVCGTHGYRLEDRP